MPVPTIDPESSVLSYPQWLAWEHTFSASNSPTSWSVASGGFPAGMVFQQTYSGTGTNTGDTIDRVAHGLPDGTLIAFTTLTGGTGLATATRYYVVNATADTFQVATSVGGSVVAITADYSAVVFRRLGHLTGTPTTPGISTVRLVATNGTGDSAEVLFTIGIEPAAAALDTNADLIWDLATNIITQHSTSVVGSLAEPPEPVLSVKEGDDLMIRLRFLKGGTFLALDTTGGNLRLVVKEFEPEGQVAVSDEFSQQGSGATTNYLVHATFDGAALAASLSNYEADGGTAYVGLAELEITFVNPEEIGPELLVLSSRTFKLRIERDIADNA